MSTITRRAALGGVASLPIAGVSGASAATSTVVETSTPEHPWDIARRLACELSDVLSANGPDGFGPAGEWYAEIYPVSDQGYDVMFVSIEASRQRHSCVSPLLQRLIRTHRNAREAFEAAINASDSVILGRSPSKAARRRVDRAQKHDDEALTAICAFSPQGHADAVAKAKYLRKFVRWGELTTDQIMAIACAGALS